MASRAALARGGGAPCERGSGVWLAAGLVGRPCAQGGGASRPSASRVDRARRTDAARRLRRDRARCRVLHDCAAARDAAAGRARRPARQRGECRRASVPSRRADADHRRPVRRCRLPRRAGAVAHAQLSADDCLRPGLGPAGRAERIGGAADAQGSTPSVVSLRRVVRSPERTARIHSRHPACGDHDADPVLAALFDRHGGQRPPRDRGPGALARRTALRQRRLLRAHGHTPRRRPNLRRGRSLQ